MAEINLKKLELDCAKAHITIDRLIARVRLLEGVIETFNQARFNCNCKSHEEDTECLPWCRSRHRIEIPETENVKNDR